MKVDIFWKVLVDGQPQLPSMVAWLSHECCLYRAKLPLSPASSLGTETVNLGEPEKG